jgi:hypothetical protein
MMVGVVQGRMIVIPRKESTLYLFERLEYFMQELKSFFHADGNGMSLVNLETEAYKVSTKDLINPSPKHKFDGW